MLRVALAALLWSVTVRCASALRPGCFVPGHQARAGQEEEHTFLPGQSLQQAG